MKNRVQLLVFLAGILSVLLVASACHRSSDVETNPYERLSKADMKYKNAQVVNFTITPRGVAETDNPRGILSDAQSSCAAELMKSNLFENIKYVSAAERADSTLIIQGELTSLRIVGTGARIWLGAMAGRSDMAVHVKLIDAATGTVIGEKDIREDTNAMAGEYTGGATDKALPSQVGKLIAGYVIDTARK
jgi:hypothetical protein